MIILRRVLYVLLAMGLLINAGCGAVATMSEKTISPTNLFSSPFPKFQMQVNPDWQYLGEFEENLSAYNTMYTHEVFFFGQLENNLYKKGLFVDFQSLPSDLAWTGSPNLESEYTIQSGTMEWAGGESDYIVVPGSPFGQNEKQFLAEKGYTLPKCSLLKVSAQQQSWVRVYLFYFTQLPSCKERWDPAKLSAEQKVFLGAFMQSSLSDMVFQ